MSDDEQEQDADDRIICSNSKKRTTDGEFSKSRSRNRDTEALRKEREVPEDAEHETIVPEHVPMQMRTDTESDSEDE
ncbi:hypothetical protein [Halococcus thailandensis]|uniref:Uncharacterized protein n=1 Tax=Halococcus thailandensis JCM 13552 TaxID=1227457 RepID=M0NG50_9EURY|nr:hypothetical protein [Halococcus thailandensis]EMA56836.1 hypothetical protein C451_00490 [Halococcus thailandensis JCM 13552]